MTVSEDTIRRVKEIELELLRDFIAVCEALGLQYYALGGTLLGAVRHQGFIPWDDDIDVGMPRADYERFLAEAQPLLPEADFVQSWQTDPEYPASFAKLRRNGTAFVERSLKNCDIHHGIYIDVFPLDSCPPPGPVRRWAVFRSNLMLQRLSCRFYIPEKTRKIRFRQMAARLMMPSLTATLRRRDRLISGFRPSGWTANFCGAWGEREIVPTDWYGAGCLLPFEGLQLRAPQDYHRWLSQVYGDYMCLPPASQRQGHHHTACIDTERSYLEYRPKQKGGAWRCGV